MINIPHNVKGGVFRFGMYVNSRGSKMIIEVVIVLDLPILR